MLNAPLQNLVGLIDARIAQLEESGDPSATALADAAAEEPVAADGRPRTSSGRCGKAADKAVAEVDEASPWR